MSVDLARRAAIDTLADALGGPVGGVRAANTRGYKRRSEDFETLSATLITFVTKHPGLRVEQINKELGTTTKALTLPIRKQRIGLLAFVAYFQRVTDEHLGAFHREAQDRIGRHLRDQLHEKQRDPLVLGGRKARGS
jgi:hypothetical protein